MKNEEREEIQEKIQLVEVTSPELKFIRRFVNLRGKERTRHQIRLFINALQRAIRERRITKHSEYASDVMAIQDALLRFHRSFEDDKTIKPFKYSETDHARLSALLGREKEYPSVRLIKSYIGLQGKPIKAQQAKNLLARVDSALERKRITKRDKYYPEIEQMQTNLTTFVQRFPRGGVLSVTKRELNGLSEAIEDYPTETEIENEVEREDLQIAPDQIVNSLDLVKMKFKTLGFEGAWLQLLGDPSRGFTMVIYGMPKFGKSVFALLFAEYLARNHGKVLYIASEEQIGPTLRKKVLEQGAAHANLNFVGALPEDLNGYDYIFVDSVNNYGLSAEDLRQLKINNPAISLIEVLQTTKDGKARGTNEYLHDADMIVNLPERGKAIQYGRYNAGGEMEIPYKAD